MGCGLILVVWITFPVSSIFFHLIGPADQAVTSISSFSSAMLCRTCCLCLAETVPIIIHLFFQWSHVPSIKINCPCTLLAFIFRG